MESAVDLPAARARAPAGGRSGTAPRPLRSDGEQSRLRLREAALELFARDGYAKTSTRAIARSAGTNIAAISYHFGDKAGLYRDVFAVPAVSAPVAGGPRAAPEHEPPLAQSLAQLFDAFIEPLRHGDRARQCMRLHLREVLEPSGLWERADACGFESQHRGLVAALARYFGTRRADVELHRLALCIAGLGVQLHLGRDLADAVAPGLNRGPKALALWQRRLLAYALAMVEAERLRRAGAPA